MGSFLSFFKSTSNSTTNWDDITFTTKPFSLKGELKEAKIVEVYDGDSCKAVFETFNKYYKWTLRLERLDTPELKTPSVLESQFGFEVRDVLRGMILNKVVKIKCGGFDKYGRLLAEIWLDGLSVNQYLIDNEYAFEYNGGTKEKWEPYLKRKGYKLRKDFKLNEDLKTKKSNSIKNNGKRKPKALKENININNENLDQLDFDMIGKKTKRSNGNISKVKSNKSSQSNKPDYTIKKKCSKSIKYSDDEESDYKIEEDYSNEEYHSDSEIYNE